MAETKDLALGAYEVTWTLRDHSSLTARIRVYDTGITCLSVTGGDCNQSTPPGVTISGWHVRGYLRSSVAPPPPGKITKAGIISELGKRGAINTGLVTTSPGLGKWYYISGVLGYVTRTRTISISNLNARNPPTKTSDIRLVENRTNVNELEKAWVIARLDELPYGAAPPPPPPPDDEGEIALAVDKTTCGIGEQIKLTGWYKNESGTLVAGHDVGFYSYLNGKRTYIGKTRTSHAGLYTFKYEPGEAGTWQFEAYNDYTSPRVTVEVTGAAPPPGKITKAGIISEIGKSGAIDLSKVSTSPGGFKWYYTSGNLTYTSRLTRVKISNIATRNPPTKTTDIGLLEGGREVSELNREWVIGILAKLPYGAAPPPPPPPDDEGEIALAVDKTTCGIGEQIKLTGWYKNESGTLVAGHDVGFYSYLNGKRTYIGKTRTSHAGLYTFKYEPGEAGTWQFEAYNDYTSPRVAVEVTGAAPPPGKITKAGIISELGKRGAINTGLVTTSPGLGKWYYISGVLGYVTRTRTISISNLNARNPPTKTSDIRLVENRTNVNELEKAWVIARLDELPYGAAPPPPPPPDDEGEIALAVDKTTCGIGEQIKLTGWYKNESGTLVAGHDVGFYSYLNGKRTYIGKTRTSHAGLYTFKYEPGEAGTWQFEAYNDYTSPRVAVEVTGAAPPPGKITKAGIISELGKRGAINTGLVTTSPGLGKWYYISGVLGYVTRTRTISISNLNARNPPTKTSDIRLVENRTNVNELEKAWVIARLDELPYGAAPPPPPPSEGLKGWIDGVGVHALKKDHAKYIWFVSKGWYNDANAIRDMLHPKPAEIPADAATRVNAKGVWFYSKGWMKNGNELLGLNYT